MTFNPGCNLPFLKDAIRRSRQLDLKNYPHVLEALCVYVLMGFCKHRNLPIGDETEEQTLAKLSIANDSDQFRERIMISLPFPDNIPDAACWYSDSDFFDTKLWDIEPEV
jgi:hypothetical protein